VADVLKIGDLLARLPSQISGGQQQRTSLARALVYPSRVYLFDEPLSNLDAKMRLEARGFLNHLQRDLGMTAVYVTHDQAEAMALATRIAVMDKGRVVHYAPPVEVYRRPATTFVASFVGSPPMNLLPVEAAIEFGRLHIHGEGLRIQSLPVPRTAGILGGKLTVGVRPEHLRVGGAGPNTISGALFANENMGPEKLVTLERRDGARFTARIFSDEAIVPDATVTLSFETRHITLFDAEGKRIPAEDEAA
jgi:ABC-type sugar transport system ATPase subunit